MSSSLVVTKPDRNRFSLILQLASSKLSSDTDNPKRTPNGTGPQPSPTRSFTSFSSKSHCTPLLQDSHLTNADHLQSAAALPPTVNELDFAQKDMLRKKARKLTRVFGEVPVLECCPSAERPSDFADICEADQDRCARPHMSKQALTSTNRHGNRPPLSTVSYSGIASTDSASNSSIRASCTGDVLDDHSEHSADDHDILYATPQLSLDRIRKARAAKLTRYLGENIPPELLIPAGNGNQQKERNYRKSFDISSLSSKSRPLTPAGEGKGVKRVLSLRTRGSEVESQSTVDRRKRHSRDLSQEVQLTEREKFLKVKRARKMTQMFGLEPPEEMLALAHNDADHASPPPSPSRDSLATHLTFSSVDLLSVSASARLANSSSVHLDVPPVRESLGESTSGLFSNSAKDDQHVVSPESPSSSSFQKRRRRAAKLSRFFGVGFQDLSSSLLSPVPPTLTPRPATSGKDCSPAVVDIKVSNRGRFWGLVDGRHDLKETDIIDARAKLRELRAA